MKRADLEKSGDLTKMLNYGKSDLVKVSPKFGGEAFELDARLSFKKDGEGNISLVPHFIRKEQKLDEYKEHKFSDEDRKNCVKRATSAGSWTSWTRKRVKSSPRSSA